MTTKVCEAGKGYFRLLGTGEKGEVEIENGVTVTIPSSAFDKYSVCTEPTGISDTFTQACENSLLNVCFEKNSLVNMCLVKKPPTSAKPLYISEEEVAGLAKRYHYVVSGSANDLSESPDIQQISLATVDREEWKDLEKLGNHFAQKINEKFPGLLAKTEEGVFFIKKDYAQLAKITDWLNETRNSSIIANEPSDSRLTDAIESIHSAEKEALKNRRMTKTENAAWTIASFGVIALVSRKIFMEIVDFIAGKFRNKNCRCEPGALSGISIVPLSTCPTEPDTKRGNSRSSMDVTDNDGVKLTFPITQDVAGGLSPEQRNIFCEYDGKTYVNETNARDENTAAKIWKERFSDSGRRDYFHEPLENSFWGLTDKEVEVALASPPALIEDDHDADEKRLLQTPLTERFVAQIRAWLKKSGVNNEDIFYRSKRQGSYYVLIQTDKLLNIATKIGSMNRKLKGDVISKLATMQMHFESISNVHKEIEEYKGEKWGHILNGFLFGVPVAGVELAIERTFRRKKPDQDTCFCPPPPMIEVPVGERVPERKTVPEEDPYAKFEIKPYPLFDPRLQYVPRNSGRVEQDWLDEGVMALPALFGGLVFAGAKTAVSATAGEIETMIFQVARQAYAY